MTAKKYPTRATFVLAEDTRQESSGKVTIAGIYPGDRIVIHSRPTAKEPAVLRMLLYFNFRDGYGKFETKALILKPDGTTYFENKMGPSEKESEGSMTVVFALMPAQIVELGTYTAIVYLDDQEYAFDFDIILSKSKTGAAPSSKRTKKRTPTKKKLMKARRKASSKKSKKTTKRKSQA